MQFISVMAKLNFLLCHMIQKYADLVLKKHFLLLSVDFILFYFLHFTYSHNFFKII